MTTAPSKRQQARNERALQDLLSQPGNDKCADCGAKNPGWASWNLGVFLCMRCGGLHRKLGTHVSKVKSLSMDSWSAEQVENMRKVGNVEGNKRWNPKGVRAELPVDADEVDGAVERFIRQKYEARAFVAGGGGGATRAPAAVGAVRRDTTGSTGTGSWSEEPPPLPPKPGKKFAGFSMRSASSVFPRGKKDKAQERDFTPPLSPAFSGSGQESPPLPVHERNTPSQMFGMKITSVGNNFDAKLATLRDMGFSDNRRNSDVLKSSNGSLDAAIEALVRLGEGGAKAPASDSFERRALTPVSMTPAQSSTNGISIDKTRQKPASSNPWEVRESTPQRAATQPLPEPPARSQSAAPAPSGHWNPFMAQAPPQQDLVQGLQGLQVSQTGPGAPAQGYGQPYQAANPWAVASTVQQQVEQVMQGAGFQAQQPYARQAQPQVQQQSQTAQQPGVVQQQIPQQQPDQTGNPFLRRAASQTFAQSNPWGQSAGAHVPLQQTANPWGQAVQQQPIQQHQFQQQPPALVQQASNPWGQPMQPQQTTSMQQPSNPFGMPFAQQQQNVFQQAPTTQSPAPVYGQNEYFAQQQQQQMQQPQTQQTMANPYAQAPQQPQQTIQNPYAQPQQTMMQPQQTGFPPQQQQFQQPPQPQPEQQQPWMYREVTAQQPQQQPQRLDKSSILGLYGMAPPQQPRTLQPVMEDSGQQSAYHPAQPAAPQFQCQQRSVTMPVQQQGAANPWGVQQAQTFPQGPRHVSNESAAFVGFAGEGRHSPDAFAGLSARYVR